MVSPSTANVAYFGTPAVTVGVLNCHTVSGPLSPGATPGHASTSAMPTISSSGTKPMLRIAFASLVTSVFFVRSTAIHSAPSTAARTLTGIAFGSDGSTGTTSVV